MSSTTPNTVREHQSSQIFLKSHYKIKADINDCIVATRQHLRWENGDEEGIQQTNHERTNIGSRKSQKKSEKRLFKRLIEHWTMCLMLFTTTKRARGLQLHYLQETWISRQGTDILKAIWIHFKRRIHVDVIDIPNSNERHQGYASITISWVRDAPVDICQLFSGMIQVNSRCLYFEELHDDVAERGYERRRAYAAWTVIPKESVSWYYYCMLPPKLHQVGH